MSNVRILIKEKILPKLIFVLYFIQEKIFVYFYYISIYLAISFKYRFAV